MKSLRSKVIPGALTAALAVGALTAAIGPATVAHADSAGQGGDFHQLPANSRVLDTRAGTGAPIAKIGAGGKIAFAVLGQAGVPGSGVRAVLLNVTVIGASAHTSLGVYPDGATAPGTSALISPATTGSLSNSVLVVPGTGGKVDITNSAGTADLIVDVQGYYTITTGVTGYGGYVGLSSIYRAADSRLGGIGGVPKAKIAANASVTITIPTTTVPANVTSVYAEVTTADATASGYLTSYAYGGTNSGAGLTGYVAGTSSNGVVLRTSATGKVVLVNHGTQSIDLVVDIEGYYSNDASIGDDIHPVQTRLLNLPTLAANSAINLRVAGANGLPTRGITSAILNITATNQTAQGYVRVDGSSGFALAAANAPSGLPHGSLIFTSLNSDGMITLTNKTAASISLFVDVEGYYSNDPDTSVSIATGATPSILQANSGSAVDAAYVNNSGQLVHGVIPIDNLPNATWTPVPGVQAFTGQPSLGELTVGSTQLMQVAVLHASNGEVWTYQAAPAGNWSPGWVHTGGIMAFPPVSANLPDGTLSTFGVDADGALWVLPQGGAWAKLAGMDALANSPTVVSTPDGIEVAGETAAGTVEIAKYSNGVLSGMTDLGGTGVSTPVAMLLTTGPRLRVVARQSDGSMISKLQNVNLSGTFPSSWTAVGSNIAAIGTPALGIDSGAGSNPGTGLCFVIARSSIDGYLYEAIETGQSTGVWNDWQVVSGQQSSAGTDMAVTPYAGSANNYHWIGSYLSSAGAPLAVVAQQ